MRWHKPVAWILKWLYLFYIKTLRLSFKGLEETKQLLKEDPKGVIFVLWHDSLFIAPLLEKISYIQPIHVLISKSRDGDLVSEFSSQFHQLTPLRVGHRSRAQALKKSLSLLKEKNSLLITPDGPRGPRRKMKSGALFASQKAHSPLVPIVYAASRSIQLPSWDRFRIPFPFSRVTIEFMKPVSDSSVEEEMIQAETLIATQTLFRS